FVLCLVAADRRFALEVPGERLEHCLRHERGARVVEMDPIPAARRFAAPAIELWSGGQSGGDHARKGRGIGPWAQVVVSSFPFPRRRRRPDTALRFKRNVLLGPLFRVGTTKAGETCPRYTRFLTTNHTLRLKRGAEIGRAHV